MIKLNSGFITLWIAIIAFILFCTGWKNVLAPDVSTRSLLLFAAACTAALPTSWWLQIPIEGHAAIVVRMHVSTFVLMAAAFTAALGLKGLGNKGYAALCSIVIALIWGSVRQLYSFDPVFYWLDPALDAPLLGGALCGALAPGLKQQFGMLVWGSIFGELVCAMLRKSPITVSIGNLAWWDGLCIALLSSAIVGFAYRGMRAAGTKLAEMYLNNKGGSSS